MGKLEEHAEMLARAATKARELARIVEGAAEGIGGSTFSADLIADVRALEQAAQRMQARVERLADRAERAYQRHEAAEEGRGEAYYAEHGYSETDEEG